MNATLRNVLAVLAGLIVGGFINGGIVAISNSIIALPEGVDPNDIESIKANLHLYEGKHFVLPFLAHALGTFVAALVALLLSASRSQILALVCGLFFLLGGTGAAVMIGGPVWFIVVDLVLAYMPMAYFAWLLVGRKP